MEKISKKKKLDMQISLDLPLHDLY